MEKHHTYLLQVLIFSIPFYLLNLLYPKPLFLGLPASIPMIIIPALLACYRIQQEKGRSGVSAWLNETWRYPSRNIIPLLLALTFMPALYIMAGILADTPTIAALFHSPLLQTLALFALYYLGACLEELGWTAYLTGPMQAKYGILKTGFTIGLVWGLWHLIPYLPQGRDAITITLLLIAAILYRIVMGYLYHYSRTTVTAILFHTTINLVPKTMTHGYATFSYLDLTILLTVATIILILTDKHIQKTHRPPKATTPPRNPNP